MCIYTVAADNKGHVVDLWLLC